MERGRPQKNWMANIKDLEWKFKTGNNEVMKTATASLQPEHVILFIEKNQPHQHLRSKPA